MKVPGPLIWKTGRQGVFVSDDPPSGSGPARRARGAPNGVAQRAYYVAKYVKLPTGGGVPPPSPYVCEGTDALCVAFPLMTKKANCRKG